MASSKKRAPASRKSREDREDIELGGDLDALFTTPLREFTQTRDDLAKRLRKEGNKEGAASVKATRRPSVSVWTLNQLARRYPQRMDALLEAGEQLREAQRGALEAGGAKGLREASQAHRALVNELLRAAPPLLSEAGYQAGGANMDWVRDSLLATPTARKEELERLEHGRLMEDIEPGDLSDVLGLMRGRPAPRPQEEPKARAPAKPAAPAKEAPAKEAPAKEKPAKEAPAKAKKAKSKAAEQPRKEAAATAREEKKRLAAKAREEKKKRAADAREEKKRLAEKQREEKKRLTEALREREEASRDSARAAQKATRLTAEAERQRRAAEEAEEAARAAMDRARDTEREAREAQKVAEEAARRLEAAERKLER